MRRVLLTICIFSFVFALSAKRVVVQQKTSEPYMRNMTLNCEYKMQHKNVEIVNHLKYIEVKKRGEVVASFDPVNIDRNSLYIWVELSPNGKMILFTTSDQGTFICNLKGEILYRLGKGVNATNWWDNRYLIGMEDKDNGAEFVKSTLVLVDIKTGNKLPIATDEHISVYPCGLKPFVEYFTLDNTKHTIKVKIISNKILTK